MSREGKEALMEAINRGVQIAALKKMLKTVKTKEERAYISGKILKIEMERDKQMELRRLNLKKEKKE